MDEATVIQMQTFMKAELKSLQGVGAKLQELMVPRSKLLSQKNENDMVKKEMDLLDDDAVVYKLVGPVLVKQEVDDAKLNVANRLKFINAELEKIEKQGKDLEAAQKASRDKVMQLQEKFREMEQATVQRALASQQQHAGGAGGAGAGTG